MISHRLIREALLDVLVTVDEVRNASAYEDRSETIGAMPYASLWWERTGPPDPDTPEFGHYELVAQWTANIYINEDTPVDSQQTAEAVADSLFDVFKDGGDLTVDTTSFRIDQARLTDVTPNDRPGSPALIVVQASITTALVTT